MREKSYVVGRQKKKKVVVVEQKSKTKKKNLPNAAMCEGLVLFVLRWVSVLV